MDMPDRILAAFAALAFAGSVAAQGRHDEKPHGTAKPAEGATISEPKVHPGGRHDEQSHKSAIAAQKKATKKIDSAKASDKSATEKAPAEKAAPDKATPAPAPSTAPK